MFLERANFTWQRRLLWAAAVNWTAHSRVPLVSSTSCSSSREELCVLRNTAATGTLVTRRTRDADRPPHPATQSPTTGRLPRTTTRPNTRDARDARPLSFQLTVWPRPPLIAMKLHASGYPREVLQRVHCCCITINCPVTVAIPIGELPELGEDLHEKHRASRDAASGDVRSDV